MNGRLNGAFKTEASAEAVNVSNGITSNFIIDFVGKYHVSKSLSLSAKIINVLDKTYAVSKVPAGLRPGHPFGIYGGLDFRF